MSLQDVSWYSLFFNHTKKKPRRSGVSLLGLWPDNPGRVHSYRVHPAEPEDPVEPQTRTFVPKYLALACGLGAISIPGFLPLLTQTEV